MSKLVRAIYGPQRGLISLEDADADAAIKAGWAVDPYTTYEIAADFDVEKATKAAEAAHAKQLKAAEAAAEAEKPVAAKKVVAEEPKASEPMKTTDDSSYSTRVSKPKE